MMRGGRRLCQQICAASAGFAHGTYLRLNGPRPSFRAPETQFVASRDRLFQNIDQLEAHHIGDIFGHRSIGVALRGRPAKVPD